MPGQSENGAPIAVSKAYDFVLWLLPKVEKFSRGYRFSVGERLSASGLDVLVLLVESAYATRKEDLLNGASRKINATRYLLRVAKDLGLLSVDSYSFGVERLDEVGRGSRTQHMAVLGSFARGCWRSSRFRRARGLNVRGGCWYNVSWYVRAAHRCRIESEGRYSHLGFRCARDIKEAQLP